MPRALSFLLVPVTLMMVAAPARSLTWQEARAAAIQRAPELKAAALRTESAASDVRVAGALANPTFTVASSRQSARLSTGVSVPLPLFGQRGLAIAAAQADADAVHRDAVVTENDLRWSATIAWVDAWEAAERARLVATAAVDAGRLLKIAEERFQAGSSPRLDVVRATADEARAKAEAAASAPLVIAAAGRLAVWVGADPLAPPTVTGSPGVPVSLPAVAILAEAFHHHPELERDRAQQRAATERFDLERRLRFPVVSAELVVSQFDPTVPGVDVLAGAAFELPLLNQRGGAVARADVQRRLADATTSLHGAHLRADLADAFHRTVAGGNRARQIGRAALPAMEEARAMTEESYRAGRADLIRVLEAERAVLELRIAQRDAVATWARSFADLERAVGHTLDGADSVDASGLR